MEYGSEVSWRGGVEWGVDRFLSESVRYELETGNRTLVILNAGTSGNR